MGTIPQLRALINEGITIGLQQFVNEYKPKMEQDAQKSEEKYYNDYSSWADGYRHFDLKNIHTITGFAFSRSAELRARFDSSKMAGGHGIWRPLSDYTADPETVFSWGFETGNHGWYVGKTPIRTYWEQYFRARKTQAKGQAIKFVISGLHSVGL